MSAADNFKDKINDTIEEANNDIDIADLIKHEQDKQWLEHGGSFGRPVFPNINSNSGNGKGNGNGNGNLKGIKNSNTKSKPNDREPSSSKRKKEIAINKYSGNGRLPLHESVVIGLDTKFVKLTFRKEGKLLFFNFLDDVEDGSDTLIPKGTIDTQSPLSYVFTSEDELRYYLNEAKKETLDSLFIKVNTTQRKFLNVEEHYHTLIAADIIYSYFQDKFPYTHYLIFVGDNGSGKNSALLYFKYLGYRVFYVVSASAANYFTVMGNREECQVSTAEDEVEDIGDLNAKEKRNLLKSGYCSGASIPKVETEGGRSQDNWLVYCHKWLAMEELKEDKYTKGILHRSFKLKMLAGDVDYNIKDVIRFADDPQYKILQDEIFDLRKRLFCYRLLHHKDPIPFVELNVKGRTAELTNPLIRLFQNSPVALEKILDSLSMFTQERNESNVNSFESKLHQSIESLLNERMLEPPTNDSVLKTYEFTNQAIKDKLIEITEAQPDPEKNNMYYSPEIGAFSQTKITNILKSKFKVESTRAYINGKTVRCVEFKKEYLDRIKATYNIPKKIEIIKPRPKTKSSDGTDGTDGNTGYRANPEEGSTTENKENDIEIIQEVTKIDENSNISYDNDKSNPSKDNSNDLVYPKMPSEVSVLSEVSEPEKPEGATYICKNCNKEQFTSCWELHKESCKGPYEGGNFL